MTPKEEMEFALAQIGGCGDSSCLIEPPKGMCTNGGCRCLIRPNDPYKPSRVVAVLRRYIKALEERSEC